MKFSIAIMFAVLAGCSSTIDPSRAGVSDPTEADTGVTTIAASDAVRLSLTADQTLSKIALGAETSARARSAAAFTLLAAESQVSAIRAERFPRLAPILSVGSSGNTTVGLSLVQSLWDFGNRGARIETAQIDVAIAQVDQWIELSEASFDALDAFLSARRNAERLDVFAQQREALNALSTTIEDRFDAGVTGRAEALEIRLVLQEIERDVFEERSEMAEHISRLNSLVDPAAIFDIQAPSTEALLSQCTPEAAVPQAPQIMRADLLMERAIDEEQIIQSQLFPGLVGNLSVQRTAGANQTGATVDIDPSQMLGWDRNDQLRAAALNIEGAKRSLLNTSEEVRLDVEQLQAEYRRHVAGLGQLDSLLDYTIESQALFDDLFASGNARIDEAIQLQKEVSAIKQRTIDLRIDALRACARIGRLNGTLTHSGWTP